ncbi:DUF3631 domain-containing protein [Streptomyces sp. NPDC047014]|uniref:DUF3631 domain-containing protein n=1 Tax=Streptomyces sp. NPDC047014 TaxID=3155736 RepID=UPI0033D226D8
MTSLAAHSSLLLQALMTTLLESRPVPHPRHQALLDAHERHLEVEAELSAWAGRRPTTPGAQDRELDDLSKLLVEHAKVGRQVAQLLSAENCCPPRADPEQPPRPTGNPAAASTAPCILAACLHAFARHGSPDAVCSADLVAELRTLPGIAEGRWPYAELTQTRLATLLRPFEVASRDITHSDGRRRKSYRRSALLAAIPADCDCRQS